MDRLERIYVWIKVVSASADGGFHTEDGGGLVYNRIVPDTIPASGGNPLMLQTGVIPLHDTTESSGTAVGFFLHGMPAESTEQTAREWIDLPEGEAWREGASGWFLMYSFARVWSS